MIMFQKIVLMFCCEMTVLLLLFLVFFFFFLSFQTGKAFFSYFLVNEHLTKDHPSFNFITTFLVYN